MGHNTYNKWEVEKAKFHSEVTGNPLICIENLGNTEIGRLSGNPDLVNPLRETEFKEWFLDTKYTKIKIDSAQERSIDRLISIVSDDEGRPTAQIAAAKLLLELGGNLGGEREGGFRDKEIDDMTEEQLYAYIASKTRKLRAVQ